MAEGFYGAELSFRQVQRKGHCWPGLSAGGGRRWRAAAFVANRPYSSAEPIQTTQESRPEGAELPKAARSDAPYPASTLAIRC